jgi:AbiV family abortive infection protein
MLIMIPRTIYKEAMNESIKNAEMFVYEAKLIDAKGSRTHALLLKNLAIEEVAKAYVCWMIANRVIPLNHPIVWPRGKKTIFRSHNVKNKIYMDIASVFLLWQMQKEGKRESGPLTKGELAGISIVTQFMGKEGTKKRSDWMYVDIARNKEGNWYVSSPLSNDNIITQPNFKQIETMIGFVKWIGEFAKSVQFMDYLEQLREETRTTDSDFPDDPIWEI